jgi:hypothetical protein
MLYQLAIALLAGVLLPLCACDWSSERPVRGTSWNSLAGEVSGAGQVVIKSPGVLVISSGGAGRTSVTRRHEVPDRYGFRFRQRIVRCGAAQGVTVHDGAFRAQLTFSADGIFAAARSGEESVWLGQAPLDHEFHDFELMVHNGIGDLYVDGLLQRTFALEAEVGTDRVEHWVDGPLEATIEVDDTLLEPEAAYIVDQDWDHMDGFVTEGVGEDNVGQSLLTLHSEGDEVARVQRALELGPSYEAIFAQRILRFGNDQGFAVYDGEFRAALLFREDGVYVREHGGTVTRLHAFREMDAAVWHQYALHVRRIRDVERSPARASLYIDANFVGEWNLERDDTTAHLEHWLAAADGAELQIDFTKLRVSREPSFAFIDRFERAGSDGSDYWMSMRTDGSRVSSWKVGLQDGEHVFESPRHGSALALLHVLAKDVKQFSGRFLVHEADRSGSLWFNLRFNHEQSRLAAHLALEDGSWTLLERDAENADVRVLAKSASSALAPGWHSFAFSAAGPHVTFALDGRSILSGDETIHQTYGRIGFQTEDAAVWFDDVQIEGDAPVERGVREGVQVDDGGLMPVPSASTGLMRRADGSLWLTNTKQTCFLSQDGGLTFRYDGTLSCGTNLIELSASGDLARVAAEVDPLSGSYFLFRERSAKGEKCREGAQGIRNLASCWAPRDKQAIFADAPRGKLMPGKLTQASSGRVLVAAPEPHGEGIGGMRVYYSDDFNHWARARVVHDLDTFGIDLEAGKVVEIQGEHFKLFMRTDRGALFESESYDGGASWTAPTRTLFRSPRADFNIERDPISGYHYMLWQYDDPDEQRSLQADGSLSPIPSRGRTRLALAVSLDGTRTWRYLMTLDDWQGHDYRHMNPSLLAHDGVLWVAVARRSYNGKDFHPDVHDLAYFRVDVRGELGSRTFPGTH